MKTKLTSVRKIPAYAVIIRAIHCRGKDQQEALIELAERGLWLSKSQEAQAGIVNPVCRT